MTVPKQKPGRSEQVVCTPVEFLDAVRAKLGIEDFDLDLAATAETSVCPEWIDARTDALTVTTWKHGHGWNWLNPEYRNIRPWVRRAWVEACRNDGARTAVLIPAAVGSNWWREWVHLKCRVLFLNGRITFMGHTKPYPKDCALLLYDHSPLARFGYDVWRWKPSRSVGAVATPLEQATPAPSRIETDQA